MSEKRPLPWSLKGVSLEAREAVRAAAQREGMSVGAWLSRTIRQVGNAEAAKENASAHPAGERDGQTPRTPERTLAMGQPSSSENAAH